MFYLIKGLEAGSWRWKGWGLGWVSSPGDPKYLAVEPVNQIFSPFGVRTKMLILTKWYPGNKVWGLIAPISMTCSPVLARSPGAQEPKSSLVPSCGTYITQEGYFQSSLWGFDASLTFLLIGICYTIASYTFIPVPLSCQAQTASVPLQFWSRHVITAQL